MIQYKVDLNLVYFVQKVHKLASQLGSTGCFIGEEDQVFAICNGLDGEYDSVVVIEQEGGVFVQELTNKLLSQEGRLKRRNFSVSLLPSANFASFDGGVDGVSTNIVHRSPLFLYIWKYNICKSYAYEL